VNYIVKQQINKVNPPAYEPSEPACKPSEAVYVSSENGFSTESGRTFQYKTFQHTPPGTKPSHKLPMFTEFTSIFYGILKHCRNICKF